MENAYKSTYFHSSLEFALIEDNDRIVSVKTYSRNETVNITIVFRDVNIVFVYMVKKF